MTKNEFFDHVSKSPNPLLFTEDDCRKVERLGQRLGDLTGQRVVEPGCGAGPLTEYLSKWVGPNGHIFAFDASGGMVEQARSRLGHLKNVDIAHAAAETVKLQPAAWDLVILFRVFPHFDNQLVILHHIRPWIAPGGRLVIANLEGSVRVNELHASFSEAVRHDHMPCARGIQFLLQDGGFHVSFVADAEDEFYAKAVPMKRETTP